MNLTTFTCNIIIPKNISKIQPILNAGWSSTANKEATTKFGDIKISSGGSNEYTNLVPNLDSTSFPVFGRDFGHITDMQVGPDGNLYVLPINPEQIVEMDRERANQGMDGIIYKISKK